MVRRSRKTLRAALLALYLLGIHGDSLALWQEEDPQPIYIFDTKIWELPEKDRISLQKGIEISNLSELLRVLEGFL